VARNLIVDLTRLRRKHQPLDEVESLLPAPQPDALAVLISEENRARVRQAMSKLSAPDRELMRLCYFDGLPAQAVADRLGTTAAVVRKRKERALSKLRAVFSAEGREPWPNNSAPNSSETPPSHVM
jgi:RNA polymerase sigma factor (sigma-70 family)